MFLKISVLKNFAIFTEKHLYCSLFLMKLKACNFIKKRLQQKCFPVNIAKFLRTPILKNICEWLLLNYFSPFQTSQSIHLYCKSIDLGMIQIRYKFELVILPNADTYFPYLIAKCCGFFVF